MTAELEMLLNDFDEDRVLIADEAFRLAELPRLSALLPVAARRRDGPHGLCWLRYRPSAQVLHGRE